ncbi:MAG: DUF5694 domain-containing protein [Novosphingobium sp.]
MRHLLTALFVLAAAGVAVATQGAAADPPAPPPVKVMVLGVYHLANPGLDVRNVEADDPTSPRRQKELAALADALAQFKPTKVMVEREARGPDFDALAYHNFTPDKLTSQRDETLQIGFRLAHQLGLKSVQGIDEQPGEGEPDYFPFDKVQGWAKAHGREGDLNGLFAQVDAEQKAFTEEQPKLTIPALLLRHNRADKVFQGHQLYTGMLKLGDGEDQPGAELNAYWYMRNAKIFAKLMLAAKPGDRVLVIFGSGHGYWLRQLAQTTPGYQLVDVVPYLKDADRRARR